MPKCEVLREQQERHKTPHCGEELVGGRRGVTGDGDLGQDSSCEIEENWIHPESFLAGEPAGCHGVGVRAGTKAGTGCRSEHLGVEWCCFLRRTRWGGMDFGDTGVLSGPWKVRVPVRLGVGVPGRS